MKKLHLFLGLFLILMLISCSVLNDGPDNPPIEFDLKYLNQQIKLIPAKEFNTFKTTDDVGLYLVYNAENDIVFPSNYNIRIFIKQDGEWLEINEKPTLRSDNKVVLSSSDLSPDGYIVIFFPALDDLKKRYDMRVYVFGDMMTKNGIQEVAAFTDFVLTP